jgi:low temperature requirement protein LtrA
MWSYPLTVPRAPVRAGAFARDAYTYGHLPIVAGIIATAVGTDLLIAEPQDALHGVGLAMMLGGPVLFLTGESLFAWRMTGTTNVPRVAVAGILVLLVPVGGLVSAQLVGMTIAALLTALVILELRAPERAGVSRAASRTQHKCGRLRPTRST